MKNNFFITRIFIGEAITLWLIVALLFGSCKRELSCEKCNQINQPPTAAAGPDQVITLPTDSVVMDGSRSSDPDGKISEWQWTKVSGPASFQITNTSDSNTMVRNLIVGIYQFELKVTDDEGASATDTIVITVDSLPVSNHPPIACASQDQVITLPINTTMLDGSCSTDPENNIVSYQWKSIAGPSSLSFTDAHAVQTQVGNLGEGIYQFELTLTDAGGLTAKDTLQIIVEPAGTVIACDSSIRQKISARLISVGTLSTPRDAITVGAVGTKIVFAGGVGNVVPTDAVDIYDTVTHQWSTAKLSRERLGMTAVSAGNKIFFAGGMHSEGDAENAIWTNIDVYDAASGSWSVMQLSERRAYIAAAALGEKVFFAGGGVLDYWNTSTGWRPIVLTNKVDIYDLSTNTWSTAALSEGRCNSSAVVVGNKIYFAGGFTDKGMTPSKRIDIYDNATQSWSTSNLLRPMGWIGGAAVNDKICWAESCGAEIRNTANGTSASPALSHPGFWNTDVGANAVIKGKNIVFLHQRPAYYGATGYDNTFDIYNAVTDTWYVGVFPEKILINAVISVNNTIYMVGGVNDNDYKSKVWKVEF